jgi:predicted ester cyclase
MLLHYSLHAPRRGHEDIKAFKTDFRTAFPDLNFWGAADLIAGRDYVVGRWEGGGTHAGTALNDFLVGGLSAPTGRKIHFTGTTVPRIKDRKIVEEIVLDDADAVGRDQDQRVTPKSATTASPRRPSRPNTFSYARA